MRASRIARLNYEFRRQAGLLVSHSAPGWCFMTAGVAALGPEAQAEILRRVRRFSEFGTGNDPYGEHDFGAIAAPGGESLFWKIDYYADDHMEYGGDYPGDPTRSFRVLTIMLAAEY